MNALVAVIRRELGACFATPLAMVFITMFLVLAGGLTFWVGGLYERGQADLLPFFGFHPWLHLFLVSALAMNLWADERRGGTLELLLTLPIPLWSAVAGKFIAAWLMVGLALLLTTPLWWTLNWLGDPDNGVIVAGYVGSWLLAGAFLAVGSCVSAATANPVIAFVVTVALCFAWMAAGFPLVIDSLRGTLPAPLTDAVASLGVLSHYQSIQRGVLDLADLLFFAVAIGAGLLATAIVVDLRKAGPA